MTQMKHDAFQKALKLRKLDIGEGDSVHITMPDKNITFNLTRRGDAYHIAMEFTDSISDDVKQAIGSWLERNTNNGDIAFEELRSKYAGLHNLCRAPKAGPNPLAFLDRPEAEREEPLPCQTYPYKLVIEVMSGKRSRKDIRWGYLEGGYGNQCVKVQMPDPSTNLIIQRQSTHEGTQHWVFLSPGEGADPEVVRQTQDYIDSYHASFIAQGTGSVSGLQVGYTRQLIENIRHSRTNQAIEPAPVKQGLIEV